MEMLNVSGEAVLVYVMETQRWKLSLMCDASSLHLPVVRHGTYVK